MKHLINNILIAAAVLFCASCSTFSDDANSYGAEEGVKDLSGVWVITNVQRNGVDITEEIDLSKFKLHLGADGTYKVENYLPFVVRGKGSWTIDDPQFPFHVLFTPEGQTSQTSIELHYPISNGVRSLLVKLSPGCYSNTYTYSMQREK